VSQQVNIRPPDLWGQRVDELNLQIESSPIGPLVQKLYAEMEALGLSLRPPVYVANEWGCPDGLPIIGVPFYLVDPRFHAYEDQYADDLEEELRIMVGLRHEVGHAINYAYKLYLEPEWATVFGDFFAEYGDDYLPEPLSRRFVRHLPGWYAQKHPDEDFAETFAVWMTPGWRERYQGWEALAKLEYVDRLMAKIGRQAPLIDPATVEPDPEELAFTVGEFYARRTEEDAPPLHEIGSLADDELKDIFPAEGIGTDAASVLWDRRRAIMKSVSGYTGARMYVVKSIIDHLHGRLRALILRVGPGKEAEAVVGVTALVAALTATFLRTGHFSSSPAVINNPSPQ
jgi:hypothetical protein